MRTESEVLAQFDKWAQVDENIRTAILAGSRANPKARLDFLSDYDIALYVTNLKPFHESDDWLRTFGSILVRWPLVPRSTFNSNWLTRLVFFEDGVRVDFQITDAKHIEPNTYDNGYRVLVDKDGLTETLNEPTFTKFNIKKPSKTQYATLINDFWWDATYVPKYLVRDELPFAKYMLDNELRYSYLHQVLEWYIGCEQDWAVNTGCHGKWFKRYLEKETWSEYQSTYAGSGIEENWSAFFRLIELFRKLGKGVAERLGYAYPDDLDQKVTEHISRIRRKAQME
ncbi:aminoglycoside 6-adenylyltransferase [Kaarinaea lacus]